MLTCKPKALKADLKVWNAEVFGNVNGQKNSFFEELLDMESREEEGVLSKEAFLRKKDVIANLERVLLLEEISWHQKSRALWLREEDKCTIFFH